MFLREQGKPLNLVKNSLKLRYMQPERPFITISGIAQCIVLKDK